MNSIYTAYIALPRTEICGRKFLYQYSHLPDDKTTARFIAWQSKACSKICKAITSDINSEWVFRQYMAAKMILAASLSTQSFVYCESANVRLPIYHLQYNALQYCCRALTFLMHMTLKI